MFTAETVKELVWLQRLLSDIKYRYDEPTILQIDNQSTVILIKNPNAIGRLNTSTFAIIS